MAVWRRHRFLLIAAGCAVAALALAALPRRDSILFNHSPSIPVGLYLRVDGPIEPGAIVTVRARDAAPAEAARRGFTENGDRFIKRVAAIAGAHVCAEGEALSIDGEVAALRRTDADAPPAWRGCRVLSEGEVLLLGDADNSFDGRYWGPIDAALIEGVWRKL